MKASDKTAPQDVFIISSWQDFKKNIFSGIAYVGSNVIIGQEGFDKYFQGNQFNPEDFYEGGFSLVYRKDRKICLKNDSMGQDVIYYYVDGSIWAASNSYFALVKYLVRKNISLNKYFPSVAALGIDHSSAQQSLTNNTTVEKIKILPSHSILEIVEGCISVKRRNDLNFSDYDYLGLLDKFVKDWRGRTKAVLNFALPYVSVGVSGGLDSRAVLSTLINTGLPLGDIRFDSNVKWSEDFKVASILSKCFDFTLNEKLPVPNKRTITNESAYELWKYGSLGVYSPFYAPLHSQSSRLFQYHGAGGGLYRPHMQLSATKYLKNVSRFFKNKDDHYAVSNELLNYFIEENVDPESDRAMMYHHMHFRARFHFGRSWYKNLTSIQLSPLMSPVLYSAYQKLNTIDKDRRKLQFDLMVNANPLLAALPFDIEGKKFSQSLWDDFEFININKNSNVNEEGKVFCTDVLNKGTNDISQSSIDDLLFRDVQASYEKIMDAGLLCSNDIEKCQNIFENKKILPSDRKFASKVMHLDLISNFPSEYKFDDKRAVRKKNDFFAWLKDDYFFVGKAKNLSKASSILNDEYQFGNFPKVCLDVGDIWAQDPFSEPNWMWRLHKLEFVKDLIEAYNLSAQYKYINKIKKMVLSWVESNSFKPYPSRFSWHDHATALRLNNYVRIWLLFQDKSEQFIQFLTKSAIQHCEFLSKDEFYSKNTNHGFDQALSLYFGAIIFCGAEDKKKFKKIASERIRSELMFAFNKEGVHVENSPGYHLHMMSKIMKVRKLFEFEDDNEMVRFIEKVLNGAYKFLTHIITPDGKLPILGDSEAKNIPKSILNANLANPKSIGYLNFAASKGQEGIEPVESFYIAPDAGYAVYRDSWSHSDSDSKHLIFKCGFKSSYHRQDDDLNILLYAHGTHWFVDCGLYKYDRNDKKRVHARSAFCHNIPVPHGAEVSRSIRNVGKYSIFESYQVDNKCFNVSGLTRMFYGFETRRNVRADKNYILIDDHIADLESNYKGHFTYFNLPFDKNIHITDGFQVVISSSVGVRLILECSDKNVKIDVINEFNDEDLCFASFKYGESEPTKRIRFTHKTNSVSYKILFEKFV